MRRLAVISMVVLLAAACKKPEDRMCYKSIGEVVTETRSIPYFNRIDLNNRINLILTQDTTESISIEGGKNLLNFVETEVIDSILYIRDNNNCAFLRSYESKIDVYVHFADLDTLFSRGEGNISATDTIFSERFVFENWTGSGSVDLKLWLRRGYFNLHTGSGDITMNGWCKSCFFYENGDGFIDARDFECEGLWVNQNSTNYCHVNVTKRLVANINYIGDIRVYKNFPTEVIENINHDGKVVWVP